MAGRRSLFRLACRLRRRVAYSSARLHAQNGDVKIREFSVEHVADLRLRLRLQFVAAAAAVAVARSASIYDGFSSYKLNKLCAPLLTDNKEVSRSAFAL